MATYPLGQAVRLSSGVIRDANNQPVTPATLTLTITQPDLTVITKTISDMVLDSTGLFHYDFLGSQPGLYGYRFVATGPNTAAEFSFAVTAPGQSAPAIQDWTPTPTDVAAILTRLTIDATGLPTGAFTATSSPTVTQVALIIADITGEIAATAGTIPPALDDDARTTCLLGTAALIEEQFGDEQRAAFYDTRYTNALTRLTTAVAQINDSGQVTPEGNPPQPTWNGPDTTCATTWATQW